MTNAPRTLALPVLAAICVALLAPALTGCESNKRYRPLVGNSSFGDDSVERQQEAIELAARAFEEPDPDTAIAMYRDVVKIYRDLYPAWNNLGTLLMEQRRYLEAAEAFNTAAGLSPTDARPVYNIGLLYDRSGYLDDAREHYSRALVRDPNYLPALRGLIRADSILNEADEETLEMIQRALRLEQNEKWREWLLLRKIRIENLIDGKE